MRRRHGQIRRSQPRLLPIPPQLLERRKDVDNGFNVAATLELNLDRFPTRGAMLTFLRTLLYNAEAADLSSRRTDYVNALKKAVDVLEHSREPTEAVATLIGYQMYMAGRQDLAS